MEKLSENFSPSPSDTEEIFLLFPLLGPITFRFWKFSLSRKYEYENLENNFSLSR